MSYQLFRDFVLTKIENDDVVRLKHAHGHTEFVDLRFLSNLEDGISTSLYEWRLSDIDFCSDREEFAEQREETTARTSEDLIEF